MVLVLGGSLVILRTRLLVNETNYGVGSWNWGRPIIALDNGSWLGGSSQFDNGYMYITSAPNQTISLNSNGTNIARIYVGNLSNMTDYFVQQDSKILFDASVPLNITTNHNEIDVIGNTISQISNATLVWTNISGTYYFEMNISNGNLKAEYLMDNLVEGIYNYSISVNFSIGTSDEIAGWTDIDLTPPASITDLQNTTTATSANWTWTDPADTDFDHVEIWLNGSFDSNISAGNQSFNATGLTPITEYIFSTRTVDTVGNTNATWVNQTTRTNATATVVNGTIIASWQQPAKLYQRI